MDIGIGIYIYMCVFVYLPVSKNGSIITIQNTFYYTSSTDIIDVLLFNIGSKYCIKCKVLGWLWLSGLGILHNNQSTIRKRFRRNQITITFFFCWHGTNTYHHFDSLILFGHNTEIIVDDNTLPILPYSTKLEKAVWKKSLIVVHRNPLEKLLIVRILARSGKWIRYGNDNWPHIVCWCWCR